MTGPKLHTVAEVADRFGIHPVTVRKKCAEREWPHLLLGSRSIRFTDAHIEAIVRDSERATSRTA